MIEKTAFVKLPFPVSVNSMFGGGSKQKRFPSKGYKRWILLCDKLRPVKFIEAAISYKFFMPDNRVRDLSNYIKACEDYLVNQQVIVDDCWRVVSKFEVVSCGIDRTNPRVEIFITGKIKIP